MTISPSFALFPDLPRSYLVAPVHTFFTPENSIDLDIIPHLARYIFLDCLYDTIFLLGTNGEGYNVSLAERK